MSDTLDPRHLLGRSLDTSRLDEDDFVINDVALRIPASEIYVEKRAYNESYQTMRTRKSRKIKSGNSVARVAFSVVFRLSDIMDQNNLIRLVGGLRATPFCPIWNAHLDRVLGHPGRERHSETSSLQPIMLGLTSMTFETMGHEGKPDCCRGSFDFLYFNYLPFTEYIAFKKGDNLTEPGYPWESPLWQAFYAPYSAELQGVAWPHLESFSDTGRTTIFGWREFIATPKGSSIAVAAAKDLADILKRKPKETMESLRSIVDSSLKQDSPNAQLNPELLTDGALDVLYRKLIHDGAISPNDEIAAKIATLEKGEITKAGRDILLPVIRNMYHADKYTAEHFQHADVAGKLLAERLQQAEASYEGKNIEDVYSSFTVNDAVKLLDKDISIGGKKGYGGLQLYGRKRYYKIVHQATQDYDTGPAAIIQRIVVSFQNILTTIPMTGHLYPTLQHMGSVDANVTFTINARREGAADINTFYDTIEAMALRFKQIPAGLTNLYIKNDFLALFGLSEFITERIVSTTLPDQPSRSVIELELSEAGLTSEDKEDDPEVIKQEFVAGSVEAFKKTWELIKKRLEMQYSLKGDSAEDLGFYLLKTIRIKRDGSQDLLASIVDEARNAYNEFLTNLHKQNVDMMGFGTLKASSGQNIFKALSQLTENSSEYGFIPGINQMIESIRLRNEAIKKRLSNSLGNNWLKKRYLEMWKENNPQAQTTTSQQMLALKAAAKDIGKQDTDKNKELVDIARQQRDLAKLGLQRYQLKMRQIFQKAIDNKEDSDLKPLEAIVEKDFLGKGRPAYPDFKKQLTSVSAFTGNAVDPKNPSAAIMKLNPDCYLWYPHLDGSGASSDLLAFIDPSIITQAKAHSLEIWNNAQGAVDQFFQNEYRQRFQNPQNMGPHEIMMQESKGKLASAFYRTGDISNATISANPPISKSVICDPNAKIHTNWYPENAPHIKSNKILYHSTDVNILWNGTEHNSHPGAAFAGANAQGGAKATESIGTLPGKDSASVDKPPFQLIWPIKNIPSKLPEGYLFGRSARSYGGRPPRMHGGLDMPHPSQGRAPWNSTDGIYGQEVYAAASGTVIVVKEKGDLRVGGIMIFIAHKGGWKTAYMHLMPGSIRVKVGDRVSAGQSIAQIGRTGIKSSPTHLHFQLEKGSGSNRQVIDPLIALPPMGGKQTGIKPSLIPYSVKSAESTANNLTSPLMRSIEGLEKDLLKGQYQSLMRAYPAFKLYFIEDDSGERRKHAFDDFFSYSAVQSIRVVRSRKIPADLCEIYLTNISGVLSNKKFGHTYYEGGQIRRDGEFHETTSPMQIDTKEENPIAALMLQEGIQINLRMGYMNDPDDLETVFNGLITEVEFSENEDLVRILAQSYAIELVQDIKGFETPQEKSSRRWFGWNFWGFSQNATTGRILEEMLAEPEVLHFGRWDPASGTGANSARELLTQRWVLQPQPADDNIFAPSPDQDMINLGTGWVFKDLKYVIYRTTIWDIFQEMTLRHPNFVASVVPYEAKGQQRSTAFFGLPNQLYFARDPKPEEEKADKKLIQAQKDIQERINQMATGNVFRKRGWLGDLLRNVSYTAGRAIGMGTPDNAMSVIQGVENVTAKIMSGGDIRYHMAVAATNSFFRKFRLGRAQEAEYIAPFRNYHLITSASHLIHNNIKANSRDIANTIVIKYNKKVSTLKKIADPVMSIAAEAAENTFTLKLDNALPTEEIKTVIGQFVNVTNEELAKRYALSILCQNLKDIYKGEIITIGMPKVKPIDVCFLMDEQNDMVGAFEVEEVQHLFSQQEGFRTAIKPDMLVQAAEWSLLSSNEAIGIVIEGLMRKHFGATAGALAAFAILPNTMTAGMQAFGGFLAQKIINLTQLGQPVIMAPMTHHGKIFAGGVPTRKIPTSTWFTGDSKWNSTIDAGYYDWVDQTVDEIGGWLKKITFQSTVGNFFDNGGNYP